ncbi:T9SS type A sorting domain-containing protein, partial [bacterium]|nr:T9SS type A sorting domain-containing protein [bacterium]
MREKKVLLWIMILFISVRLISLTREEVIEETQYLETTKDINIEKIMFFEDDYYDDWYEYTHNNLQSANIGDYSYRLYGEAYKGGYRRFYEFPFMDPPLGWEILSVKLKIYQSSSCGNGQINQFPTFMNADFFFLKVALLDIDMDNLGLTFAPSVFEEIGVISNNPIHEWKELDVTQAYLTARDELNYTAFCSMLYFDLVSDLDGEDDYLSIDTASSSNRPKLLFQYVKATSNSENECESITPLIHCYPNPTSEMLTIKNESKKAILAINIYNVKGQKVYSNQNVSTKNGEVNLALPTN